MIVSCMDPSAAWTASRVQEPSPTPALALMSSMLASDPALADTHSPIPPRSLGLLRMSASCSKPCA